MGLTSQQPRIAILGAGIGGLALAIGLTRQNVPYTIYEAAPDFSAIGAGIALGPNSVRAMNLIDPELKALYDKISNGNKSPDKKHVFADFLLAEPGFGINQGWEAKPVWSKEFEKSGAHRQDLLDIMTKLISTSNVKFNKRAVDVEQVDKKVFITFADGEKIEADAVIGCDGGKGVSRKAVLGAEYSQHVAATYSGRYVYRSIVPAKESKETLGDYANDGKMFFGPGLYFSVYQLPGGKSNLVAARQNGEPWNHAQWTQEVTTEEMMADFEGCDTRLLKLLEWAKPTRWALFHHLETPTYYRGNMALLGDVAHASTPHQGSGAGQCLEDALILSRLLGQVKHPADIEVAFKVYDSICRPRGQGIVRTSNEAGLLYMLSDPECGSDMEKVVENANKRFLWIWTHDLEADIKKAEDQFRSLKT